MTIAWLAGMVWGTIVTLITTYIYVHKRYDVRPKLPFRWECPMDGCNLVISANYDPAGFVMVIDDHLELHNRQQAA